MLTRPTFDTNRNNVLSLEDGLSSGIEFGFSPGGVTSITNNVPTANANIIVSNTVTGKPEWALEAQGAAGLRGRITWKEFSQ